MHGAKLKGVLDDLGFRNVQTLISSGNVLFESSSKDSAAMEAKIEAAWPQKLGFNSTTIIRSQDELKGLVAKNPYKGVDHSRQNYQLVTFFKKPLKSELKFPFTPEHKAYTLLGQYQNAIYSRVDTTGAKTPDFMLWLERQFGKEITSRTYKTVQRIIKKMEQGRT
jgi:uncharacterized protein (DUF1697 family)